MEFLSLSALIKVHFFQLTILFIKGLSIKALLISSIKFYPLILSIKVFHHQLRIKIPRIVATSLHTDGGVS